jgi:SAM-dependent methyltransferase
MAGFDRQRWNRRYREAAETHRRPEPNPLALRWRERMIGGRMLDAACGLGRGIASAGPEIREVYAVDISDVAVAAARRLWAGRPIRWIVGDVTALRWPPAFFGLVCAFAFTDRPFFRRIQDAICPGGMFLYEGFSRRQMEVKPDLNPEWTSTPDQMAELFGGWQVLECAENPAAPFRTRLAAIKPF